VAGTRGGARGVLQAQAERAARIETLVVRVTPPQHTRACGHAPPAVRVQLRQHALHGVRRVRRAAHRGGARGALPVSHLKCSDNRVARSGAGDARDDAAPPLRGGLLQRRLEEASTRGERLGGRARGCCCDARGDAVRQRRAERRHRRLRLRRLRQPQKLLQAHGHLRAVVRQEGGDVGAQAARRKAARLRSVTVRSRSLRERRERSARARQPARAVRIVRERSRAGRHVQRAPPAARRGHSGHSGGDDLAKNNGTKC
jgi:hypothetical protein